MTLPGSKVAAMAWRQLRRDFAAGDIRILFAALVLAVVAVTAVGFVTDRAERALAIEANRLLGGDAVVRGDAPIEGVIREAAASPGLQQADTVELDSMIRVGTGDTANLRLGDVRALGDGFPLRGTFRIVGADGVERDAAAVPETGTLWMSRAGADTLGASIGDEVGIGSRTFRLTALVVTEPDASIDYFNVAPKVFLPLSELESTGLVQLGSRIRYRLVIAGDATAVDAFAGTARANLGRGQRIETITDARPEVRSSLDRAGRFLGLAALVSVILAAVAVAMAARQHSERHLSSVAVMRCLGAQQRTLVGIHVGELLLLGLIACTLGVALAFGLQWGVGAWLEAELGLSIPSAGWLPALQGYGVGLVVLMAFGAPPVLALRRVPALRVLRRDLDGSEPSAWLVGLTGLAGLAGLLWWKAGSATLGGAMLLGILATFLVLALLAWGLILLVRALRTKLRGSLRYGLANVSRRASTSIAQISALGLGLMALLLLTFVRTDLLDRWQLALGQEAPNRFIINVQPEQLDPVRAFIADQGVDAPVLFPMIRARLIERNGEPVRGDDYVGQSGDEDQDRQSQRRAEREFNLSMQTDLRDDNQVTAGTFWGDPVEGGRADRIEARRGLVEEQQRHRRAALRGADHQPAQHRMGELPAEFLRRRVARGAGRVSRQPHHRGAGAARAAALHRRAGAAVPEPVGRRHRRGAAAGPQHRRPGVDGGAGRVLVLAGRRRAGAAGGGQRQPGRAPARRRGDARARRQTRAVASGAGVGVRGDRPARGPGRGDRGLGAGGRGRGAGVRSAVAAELGAGRGRRRDRRGDDAVRRVVGNAQGAGCAAVGDPARTAAVARRPASRSYAAGRRGSATPVVQASRGGAGSAGPMRALPGLRQAG